MKYLSLLALSLGLVACGSSNDATNSSSSNQQSEQSGVKSQVKSHKGQVIHLEAKANQLRFVPSKLRAKAGNMRIVMHNPSSLPHAIAVEGQGIDQDGKTVTKGG